MKTLLENSSSYLQLEKDPEPVIEAIQQGFIIGNHSYSHPNFSKISTSKCIEEIDRTDQIIDDLYKQASVERPIKLFINYKVKSALKIKKLYEIL